MQCSVLFTEGVGHRSIHLWASRSSWSSHLSHFISRALGRPGEIPRRISCRLVLWKCKMASFSFKLKPLVFSGDGQLGKSLALLSHPWLARCIITSRKSLQMEWCIAPNTTVLLQLIFVEHGMTRIQCPWNWALYWRDWMCLIFGRYSIQ